MKESTVQKLLDMGCGVWEKHGKKRIYLNTNNMADLIKFEYTTYKTGNISSATLDGEHISKSKGSGILADLTHSKVYYDFGDGEMHAHNTDGYNFIYKYTKLVLDTIKAMDGIDD